MSETICGCGKPTRDHATMCDSCASDLTRALAEVPFLVEQLDITISRQRAAATTGSAPSAERGLPWHDKGAEVQRNLHNLLVLWARLCYEEGVRYKGGSADLPADNTAALSRWLLCRVDGLKWHPAGTEASDEITDAVAECRRIVFWKRKNRIYLGACEKTVTDDDGAVLLERCSGEVYAEEGADVGTCDLCGQGVTVVIRQGELNKRLDDRLCTPAEIATYAVYLGLEAPREKVRNKVNYWSRHKRIADRGTDQSGSPLFRYGEVRPMLYAEFRRDTA